MKGRILVIILFVLVVIFTGCRRPERVEFKPPYDKPLAPGQQALRRITNPEEIPDFTVAALDLKDLQSAVERSISYLSKPSSEKYFPCCGITHSHAKESLEEFSRLLDSGLIGRPLHNAILDKFDVYMSVGCDDNGTVLFTGYYTPILNGSEMPSGKFRYPLYKQPENLVKGENGEILGRRLRDDSVIGYPPRAVIEDSRMLQGDELIWLEDEFEAYIAHVQGSAKIRLPNGELATVGYTANNGREYKSISQEMIKDGVISKNQLSLSAMIDYFKRNADQVKKYVSRNPRFVFFSRQEGMPRGSLNEPVTAMRTIATDKSIFPRGSLTFISAVLPRKRADVITNQAYTGFALDQDTGGAIRAPGRCDVYMGVGDEAGKLAGQTYREGKLYYLFLKKELDFPLY